MKNKLTLILLLVSSFSFGRNWYISQAGNDVLNTGQSISSAWATIAKLNANFASIVAGDSILFRRGDTFYGTIIVGKAGAAGRPIVFGAYGSGEKPVISGLTTLGSWTNVLPNIWECDAPTLKKTVNIVLIDGKPYDVGRTPNGWFTYQSASTNQLTSNSLTGSPSYVGAEIVVKKNSFTIARSLISAQSGNTVTYQPVNGIDNNNPLTPSDGKAGFGFFLQRFAGSLDLFGEWYFNPATKKLRIFSASGLSSMKVQASYIDTLMILGNKTNLVVDNLAFEGAGMYAIESMISGQVTIQNCDFDNNTRAVYVWNCDDILVQHNKINNSFNNAILISNRQRKRATCNYNLVTNTGKLIGVGTFPSNNNLKAVVVTTDTTRANNFVKIIGNQVHHTGYMGIEFQGSNVTVRYNHVTRYDSTLDDGGGIYTFKSIPASNLNYYNRLVEWNIVSDAIGSPDGTNRTTPDVAGLYYDEQTERVISQYNTVYNIPGNGIQLNSPLDMAITGNLFYNCDYSILLAKKAIREVSGVTIKHNTIYQKTGTQYAFFHLNQNLQLPSSMTITQSLTRLWDMDSNYISNLKPAGYGYYYSPNGVENVFPPDFNYTAWKGTYGHDVHSILPPKDITGSNVKLVINPSETVKTENFQGESWMDPTGSVYENAANIGKFGSMLLFYNGSATSVNTPPTVAATADQEITFPVNTVSVSATASDGDGTIQNFHWDVVQGPTGFSFGGTDGSATATVTFTVPGVYVLRVTVTDNDGASAEDTLQVKVNDLPEDQPPTILSNGVFLKMVKIP